MMDGDLYIQYNYVANAAPNKKNTYNFYNHYKNYIKRRIGGASRPFIKTKEPPQLIQKFPKKKQNCLFLRKIPQQ
jgi:hypothetical protein